jgi:endonuclease YncB( thermonuclease family)
LINYRDYKNLNFFFHKLVVFQAAWLIFFTVNITTAAELNGKVIRISDGDTITVIQDRTQYKIRLYGIDCPESHQDFGTRAKQFTSDLVFGKLVKVVQQDMDRYGRTIGIVYIGGVCVNQEIIKNGFAWLYQRYCNKPICQEWGKLEQQARISKIGLWSHPNPIPPWDFRKGNKASFQPAATHEQSDIAGSHDNVNSMIFYQPSCKYYNYPNYIEILKTREENVSQGYRPCEMCRP